MQRYSDKIQQEKSVAASLKGEASMSDVELYIAQFNTAKQERLLKIRSAVREKFPNATERVYYGIPTVEENGKIVTHYAAYKNHVSLNVGCALAALLQETRPQYRYTQFTVVMPDSEPFPEDFVKEICGMLRQND